MGWTVELDGVRLGTPDVPDVVACLTAPPSGLGLPGLRTEDAVWLGRDGVRHFADWYQPRIVTLQVSVCPSQPGCVDCAPVRQRVAQIVSAWSRRCDDAALTIYPPCVDPDGRVQCDPSDPFTLPYQVIGRPRVADVTWAPSNVGCADLLLRFDGVDQRLLLADCAGQLIVDSQQLFTETDVQCRDYPRCYDGGTGGDALCYSVDVSPGPGGAVNVNVNGTECVCPSIVFTGPLTDPELVNVDDGRRIGISGSLQSGETFTVEGCLCTGSAGGEDRSWRVTGDCPWELQPGTNVLQLVATAGAGSATVSWSPALLVG